MRCYKAIHAPALKSETPTAAEIAAKIWKRDSRARAMITKQAQRVLDFIMNSPDRTEAAAKVRKIEYLSNGQTAEITRLWWQSEEIKDSHIQLSKTKPLSALCRGIKGDDRASAAANFGVALVCRAALLRAENRTFYRQMAQVIKHTKPATQKED